MSVALTTLRGKSQTSQDDLKHDNNSSSDTESDGGGGDEGSKNPPASGTARHGNLSALEIQMIEKQNRLLDIQIQEKEDEAKNKPKTKKQRFCETWWVFLFVGLFTIYSMILCFCFSVKQQRPCVYYEVFAVHIHYCTCWCCNRHGEQGTI